MVSPWYDSSVASHPVTKFFKGKRDTSIHKEPVSPTKELRILIEEAMHQDFFSAASGEQEYLTTVSTYIGQMPFLWVSVLDNPSPKSERAYLELNCIALLSNFERPGIDPPSPNWLGLQSSKRTIRESGLWNTNHVEKFHDPFLGKLRAYAGGTVA